MKLKLFIIFLILSIGGYAQYPILQKGYLNISSNQYSYINVPNSNDTIGVFNPNYVKAFKPLILPTFATSAQPNLPWYIFLNSDSTGAHTAFFYTDASGTPHVVGAGGGGGGGSLTVGTFSGSSQTNGANITSGVITFGPADGTNAGMIKPSGAQTLGATLTLTNQLTLPPA